MDHIKVASLVNILDIYSALTECEKFVQVLDCAELKPLIPPLKKRNQAIDRTKKKMSKIYKRMEKDKGLNLNALNPSQPSNRMFERLPNNPRPPPPPSSSSTSTTSTNTSSPSAASSSSNAKDSLAGLPSGIFKRRTSNPGIYGVADQQEQTFSSKKARTLRKGEAEKIAADITLRDLVEEAAKERRKDSLPSNASTESE